MGKALKMNYSAKLSTYSAVHAENVTYNCTENGKISACVNVS